MLAQLATKSKRVEPSRATTEPSRASYRATSILSSPNVRQHTVLNIPPTRSFLYTPRIRRSRASGTRRLSRQQALVAPSAIFFMFLGPHVGAQSLCACPPSAIKGEACDVTRGDPILDLAQARKFIQALKQYITQWSRVLRSGGPNHSKSLCVLVFPPSFQLTSKTLRTLLILGFRAGALRHPARDFLSDTHVTHKNVNNDDKSINCLHSHFITMNKYS